MLLLVLRGSRASWESASVKCEDLLTSDQVLTHYEPNARDACAYGIGAEIQHTVPLGQERVISYAS